MGGGVPYDRFSEGNGFSQMFCVATPKEVEINFFRRLACADEPCQPVRGSDMCVCVRVCV